MILKNRTNLLFLKKALRFLLLFASTGYIIYFFFKNKSTIDVAFSIDSNILISIILLQLLFIALQSWQFLIVIKKCTGTALPYFAWMRIFVLGRFLNLVFSQAGNIYRGIQLKQKYGIAYTRYISVFASITWIDTCINLLFAIAVILITDLSLQIGQFVAWKTLTILLILCILGPILLEVIFNIIPTDKGKTTLIHTKLIEVLHATVANIYDLKFLLKIFTLSFLLFIRTVIAFHLYFAIFNIPVSLTVLAIFNALFKLCIFVVLTPGNIGVQEVVWGHLSKQVSIGMGQGILIAGFIRVVSSAVLIITGIAFGGISLLKNRGEYRPSHSDKDRP